MTRPQRLSAAAKKAARNRKRMAEAKAKAKREEKIVSREEQGEGKAS